MRSPLKRLLLVGAGVLTLVAAVIVTPSSAHTKGNLAVLAVSSGVKVTYCDLSTWTNLPSLHFVGGQRVSRTRYECERFIWVHLLRLQRLAPLFGSLPAYTPGKSDERVTRLTVALRIPPEQFDQTVRFLDFTVSDANGSRIKKNEEGSHGSVGGNRFHGTLILDWNLPSKVLRMKSPLTVTITGAPALNTAICMTPRLDVLSTNSFALPVSVRKSQSSVVARLTTK